MEPDLSYKSRLYLIKAVLLIVRRNRRVVPTVKRAVRTNTYSRTSPDNGYTCILNSAATHDTGRETKLNSVNLSTLST
jgi:hypothetical protein